MNKFSTAEYITWFTLFLSGFFLVMASTYFESMTEYGGVGAGMMLGATVWQIVIVFRKGK